MKLGLSTTGKILSGTLKITGSKSESNRLLILQALFPQLSIENLSNSDDTKLLQNALTTSKKKVDIAHAGTAMRFLTAYFAIQEGEEVFLTGSQRMRERPIEILVDALNDLGADISYLETEGFPPLRIKGKKLTKSRVFLQANVSSQYISALMLIAPTLSQGLEIILKNTPTSVPYLNMTKALLEEIGIKCSFQENKIRVFTASVISSKTIHVESDWSSASYFYSAVALSETAEIVLEHYKKNSFQGDSALVEMYQLFGVSTHFSDGKIRLKKTEKKHPKNVKRDLSDTPDMAQTLVVTCLGLGLACELTGLHTLRIKETDRLAALKTELEKFGAVVAITQDSLRMVPAEIFPKSVEIQTYNDHRMAMAFAGLALKTDVVIQNPEVVSKSYPDFWEDMKLLGFQLKEGNLE